MDRIGMTVDFNHDDAKVIGYLMERFDKHDDHVATSDIAAGTQLPLNVVEPILERFVRYQMMCRVTRGEQWSIEPQLLSVADQLRPISS
jgi:hypothetical protein